jgi:hypothetical protein
MSKLRGFGAIAVIGYNWLLHRDFFETERRISS